MTRAHSPLEGKDASPLQRYDFLPVRCSELLDFISFDMNSSVFFETPDPTFAFSQNGASAGSQLPSSEAPSSHPDTAPTIHPAHQSYVCSWKHQGSDTQCNHVAPNRSAFLRHLGEIHQVSGAPDVSIVCHLLDSKIASACNTLIQRGSFPRHVDTHYPVRYQCQHCTAGKSFSRQDSWRKHIRTVHPQAPPAS